MTEPHEYDDPDSGFTESEDQKLVDGEQRRDRVPSDDDDARQAAAEERLERWRA
jgi:hypothetical protein